MKLMKRFSTLTAGSIAIFLQLGSSMALAQDVCLDGDTVVGIKNMELITDQYGTVNVDVDFRYATGYEVYGSDLSGFPYNLSNAEEDLIATMTQINEVLGATNPVPGSAGQPGQDTYYIGAEEEGGGFIGATGSENLTGTFWDPCTMANDCIAGVAILDAGDRHTYADLNKASGGACDGGPPPEPEPTFTITPGISGSWFDPARSGEGFSVEVIGSSLEPEMLAYFYTFDASGGQMWLIAQGPINGDTATLSALVASGAVFGDGFDPDDVILTEWGTLTFVFTSCSAGVVTYNSTLGFGSGTLNIVRLANITGLLCP